MGNRNKYICIYTDKHTQILEDIANTHIQRLKLYIYYGFNEFKEPMRKLEYEMVYHLIICKIFVDSFPLTSKFSEKMEHL